MQGMYVNGNGKEIRVVRQQWQWCRCEYGAGKARARGQWHGSRPAQARQGRLDDGVAKEVTGEKENG
jgi:hypothetical protein